MLVIKSVNSQIMYAIDSSDTKQNIEEKSTRVEIPLVPRPFAPRNKHTMSSWYLANCQRIDDIIQLYKDTLTNFLSSTSKYTLITDDTQLTHMLMILLYNSSSSSERGFV
jgi:hypothetical protein